MNRDRRVKRGWLVVAGILLLAGCASELEVDTSRDVAAIAADMHARFDRPDAVLETGPIVVSGEHAIAGWIQGNAGGRALFERRSGKWEIVLCSGDALLDAGYLRRARVPQDNAEQLATLISEAERGLSPARLQQMASFTGTVMAADMPDQTGTDAPHHNH